jgi:hypothetical protein
MAALLKNTAVDSQKLRSPPVDPTAQDAFLLNRRVGESLRLTHP